MKRCPKCNAQFGDGATYCEYCGTKLVKPFICPQCGAEIDEDAAFCPQCGHAMHEAVSVFEENKVDSSLIEQYKQEIPIFKRKRASMFTAGGILLGVGLTLFIVFLVLFYKIDPSNEDLLIRYGTIYLFLMILGELILDAGIALMIVAGAVFSRKIANRERIISEQEHR